MVENVLEEADRQVHLRALLLRSNTFSPELGGLDFWKMRMTGKQTNKLGGFLRRAEREGGVTWWERRRKKGGTVREVLDRHEEMKELSRLNGE